MTRSGSLLLAFYGVATLIASAVLALALAIEPWAAALVVALVLLAAAGVLALTGKRQGSTSAHARAGQRERRRRRALPQGEGPPMTDAGSGPTIPTDDPEVVRAQIAEKRQALGETVEALVDKTDVKGHVTAKVDEGKAQLADQGERVAAHAREAVDAARQRPVPLGVVAAIVALLAVIFVVRRSRN